MKKLLILFIYLMFFTISANAEFNQSIFYIENVKEELTYTVNDNINSKIILLDDSDRIIKTEIDLNNDGNVLININITDMFNIGVLSKKYTYLSIFPMQEVIMYGYINNATFMIQSENYSNYFNNPLRIRIVYDIETENTTIKIIPNLILPMDLSSQMKYETDKNIGFPAKNLSLTANRDFNFKIDVIDYSKKIKEYQNKEALSGISSTLYYLLTIGGLFESSYILTILRILDSIFYFFNIVFNLLFVYKYLVIIWIMIIGNIFVGFKSNTLSELPGIYVEYYSSIFKIFFELMKYVYDIIIKLIGIIRG